MILGSVFLILFCLKNGSYIIKKLKKIPINYIFTLLNGVKLLFNLRYIFYFVHLYSARIN